MFIEYLVKKKKTMLLSKYFNFYLITRKHNIIIKKSTYKNLCLNVKIQLSYTAKLEYLPCMT